MENVAKMNVQSTSTGWMLYEGASTKDATEPLYIAEKSPECDDDDCCISFTDRQSKLFARSSMPKMLAWRDSDVKLIIHDRAYSLSKLRWWKTQRNFIVNSHNNHVLATFTYSHWSRKKLGIIRLYSAENTSDRDKVLFALILSIMAKVEHQRQLEVVF
ncbi:hypothetical protein E3P91_00342 [Wallemia ichthyophaga]|nr:hypothetical protein E3P91_00342 [Wallemia ichthyophaga]